MGILEIILALALASGAGYQAGKAGQKADSVNQMKVCFDEAYGDREEGCYALVAPSEAYILRGDNNKTAKKSSRRMSLK